MTSSVTVVSSRGAQRLVHSAAALALAAALTAAAPPKGAAGTAPGVEVKLSSTPAGAAVEIDGKALLTPTPTSTKLTPGRHRVVLTHEGFAPLDTKVVVKAGKGQRVELQLTPLGSKLTVSSVPDGAEGRLDGVAVGTTPFTTSADAGVHQIDLTAPGYRPAHREVELAPGGHTDVELKLEPLPVRVDFDVAPPGGPLTIDGADGGIAPISLELAPGFHSGLASHAGYRPQALAFEVRAGTPTRVTASLEPAPGGGPVEPAPAPEPPLPPPPPPPREDLALVADENVDIEVKLGIVRAAAQRGVDVTSLVLATRPRAQRGVLCREVHEVASQVAVEVLAVDPFGDSVPGTLVVDGLKVGPLPFRGRLPVCTGTLTGTDLGTPVPVEQTVELESSAGRAIKLLAGGRKGLSVFSLLFEYDTLSWSAAGVTQEPQHLGWGVRYDAWGRVLHFTAALKTSPAMNVPASKVALFGSAALPGVVLGGFPTADLFIGWGSALGNLAIDRARVHWAFDLGLWGLVFPTARASLAFNLLDHFFVSVGGDLHFNPLMLVFAPSTTGVNPFKSGVLFPGITVAVGGGF